MSITSSRCVRALNVFLERFNNAWPFQWEDFQEDQGLEEIVDNLKYGCEAWGYMLPVNIGSNSLSITGPDSFRMEMAVGDIPGTVKAVLEVSTERGPEITGLGADGNIVWSVFQTAAGRIDVSAADEHQDMSMASSFLEALLGPGQVAAAVRSARYAARAERIEKHSQQVVSSQTPGEAIQRLEHKISTGRTSTKNYEANGNVGRGVSVNAVYDDMYGAVGQQAAKEISEAEDQRAMNELTKSSIEGALTASNGGRSFGEHTVDVMATGAASAAVMRLAEKAVTEISERMSENAGWLEKRRIKAAAAMAKRLLSTRMATATIVMAASAIGSKVCQERVLTNLAKENLDTANQWLKAKEWTDRVYTGAGIQGGAELFNLALNWVLKNVENEPALQEVIAEFKPLHNRAAQVQGQVQAQKTM